MKATFAAVALAAISGAAASNVTAVYVTEVVTALTTYCPEATVVTHGGSTYSVSEATTLTITNCPCTVTHSSTAGPVATTAPYHYSNATMTTSGVAAPTGTSSYQSTYTGSAAINQAGLGLAAVMGLVAFAL